MRSTSPPYSLTALAGRRMVLLAALALGASACERGCLSPRPGSPGAGGEGPRGSSETDAAASLGLSGTDCSDGLARCVAGRVESSVAGHVPHPCTQAPRERSGTCECPWAAAGRCAAGCVKDGVEVVASPEVAAIQLCNAVVPVLRPVTALDAVNVAICAEEGVSCVDGLVRACAAPSLPVRLVAACVSGCAPGVAVELGDLLTGDGVAAILCRRDHAERR